MDILTVLRGHPFLWHAIRIAVYFLLGFFLIYFIKKLIRHSLSIYASEHIILLAQKVVWYGGIFFIGMSILRELGFDLSVLLGAAGIFGVAIGFASQQTVSNIISGLFLLSEASVKHNDMILIGSTQGTIISMDLLSIKLKTLQGDFVRIPYTTVFQNNLVNKSYFKEGRRSIRLVLPNSENLVSIMNSVKGLLDRYSLTTEAYSPVITITQVTEELIMLQLDIWLLRTLSAQEKNELLVELKKIVPNLVVMRWQ